MYAAMILLLIACRPPEKEPTDDWHLLFTGQAPYKGDGMAGIWETDLDFQEVWRVELPGTQGGFGATRLPGKETLYARSSQPPHADPSVEIADAQGNVSWIYDPNTVGAINFPHGVATSASGDYIAADAFAFQVIGIHPSKNLAWKTSLAENLQAPTGVWVGMLDGQETMVVPAVDEPYNGGPPRDQVWAYRLEASGPTLAWVWPPENDPTEALWVHGARILEDNTILVSIAGLGRIVRLDAQGNKIAQYPSDDRVMLSFPRDALFLPDGDLLVVDSVEVLKIHDPENSFEIVDAIPAPFSYSVQLLDCSLDLCINP